MMESEATIDKVIEAAKIADIHNFITSLPQVSLKIKHIKTKQFRATTQRLESLVPSSLAVKNKELQLPVQLSENQLFYC